MSGELNFKVTFCGEVRRFVVDGSADQGLEGIWAKMDKEVFAAKLGDGSKFRFV